MSQKKKTNQVDKLKMDITKEIRKNNLRLPLSVNTLGIASTPKTKQQTGDKDK